ncbi:MAG TPA: serine hydrolase, partial [Candidatus Baltobacteraceae bacterium]|nr:serine hydrolase [Candidatus Baltobacteraceae bacterium]
MNASTCLQSETLRALAAQAGLVNPSISIIPLEGQPSSLALQTTHYPASMIKTPLAAALCALWESGELRRDETRIVEAQNLTANDSDSPLEPGYEARLEELARLMLVRSDNIATNVLIDAIGRERGTGYCCRIGLRSTAIRRKLSGADPLIADPPATGRNAHPAADAAQLFSMIAKGSIAGASWLFDTLADQEWNDKLSAGWHAGDRFAHKTGDTSEVSHDGGILTTAEGRR